MSSTEIQSTISSTSVLRRVRSDAPVLHLHVPRSSTRTRVVRVWNSLLLFIAHLSRMVHRLILLSVSSSSYGLWASCPSFPLSSANAARHLRGQQVGRQTLMVHTISPTPGIRQVSAPSCATSSPHCPRTLHGFLHSNGGGTISSTSSSPAFQPIFCMSIPTAKAHSCGTPVSTGKADIYDKYHFSGFTVLPISPVILSVPISPLL
jgi:hypothetical protein